MYTFLSLQSHMHRRAHRPAHWSCSTRKKIDVCRHHLWLQFHMHAFQINSQSGFTFPLNPLQVSSQSRNLLRYQHYTLACLLSQPLGAVSAIFSSAVPVPDGHRTSFTTLTIPVPSRCTRPLFGHGPSYKNYVRRLPDSQLKRQYPLPTPGTSTYRYIVLGCGSFVRGRKRKKGDSIPFILSRRDYISRLPDECPSRASTHQMNYPVSQSYSPATGPSIALRT